MGSKNQLKDQKGLYIFLKKEPGSMLSQNKLCIFELTAMPLSIDSSLPSEARFTTSEKGGVDLQEPR